MPITSGGQRLGLRCFARDGDSGYWSPLDKNEIRALDQGEYLFSHGQAGGSFHLMEQGQVSGQ